MASKIAEQKETIQKLNGKIQEHNLTKKNIAIIETIKEPVIELASALGYTAQSNLDDGHKWKLQSFIRYIIPWINTILGVIIISILIFPSKEKNIEQHDDLYVLNDTINMLKAENEDLKSQIQVVEQSKENMIIEDVNHTFGTGSYDAIESPTKPARIDASDYNARKNIFLKIGQTHYASIQNVNNSNNQKWTIKIGRDDGVSITFKPKSTDVTLIYDNSKGEHIERKLIAKQQKKL